MSLRERQEDVFQVVVADGSPVEVADAFGHGDLEGVFLHLAGTVIAEDQIEDLGLLRDEEVPT